MTNEHCRSDDRARGTKGMTHPTILNGLFVGSPISFVQRWICKVSTVTKPDQE